MASIVDVLEDYRPLMDVDVTRPEYRKYIDTKLIDCAAAGCGRGVIVTEKTTLIMMEIIDECGWSISDGLMWCPEHAPHADTLPRKPLVE